LILRTGGTGSGAGGVDGERDGQHLFRRESSRDRGYNARKSRQTYRFSEAWLVHEAMTYFTLYRKRAITAHHLGIRFAGESSSPQR
jgi:hypothetical protein